MLKEVTISEPRIPVYSNATAEPMGGAADVAPLLARQLVEPVRWEGILRALVATGKTEMVRRSSRRRPCDKAMQSCYRNCSHAASLLRAAGRHDAEQLSACSCTYRAGAILIIASTCVSAKEGVLHLMSQVELGPGAQIKAMTKRIDNAVWKAFKNVAS